MIYVTKINDKEIMINCDLIECVESNPDTTITMTTGRKIIVKESVEDIKQRTVDYKRQLFDLRK